MSDTAQIEFSLESAPPRPVPPRAGAGRPKGAKNKRSGLLWRKADIASPEILEQRIRVALRFEQYVLEGDAENARLALIAGDHILSRTWPKPKTPPIQLDVTQAIDARTLLALVADGQMSPTDASSLWNSLSRNGHGATAVIEAGQQRDDIREKIAERLGKMIEARRAPAVDVDEAVVEEDSTEPDVDGEPAADNDAVEAELREKFAAFERKFGYEQS